MNDKDRDKLLEEGLSGDPPGEAFRARVLLDSTAALVQARRNCARWRLGWASAAAVFLAAASFLLGRCSVSGNLPQSTALPTATSAVETVAVPSDLVAWLDAAQLFRQLGMEARMARAVDRASQLLPRYTVIADAGTGQAFARGGTIGNQKPAEPPGVSGPDPSFEVECVNRILGHYLGD